MNDKPEQTKGAPAKAVDILVNGKPVTVPDKEVTGLQIKEAAIAQGVNIKLNFLVFRDLSNGQQASVKDDETIKVHHKERFDVLCNDDHS
jgi:L-cysteine desulfidase